jgi:hypothetical protein
VLLCSVEVRDRLGVGASEIGWSGQWATLSGIAKCRLQALGRSLVHAYRFPVPKLVATDVSRSVALQPALSSLAYAGSSLCHSGPCLMMSVAQRL